MQCLIYMQISYLRYSTDLLNKTEMNPLHTESDEMKAPHGLNFILHCIYREIQLKCSVSNLKKILGKTELPFPIQEFFLHI